MKKLRVMIKEKDKKINSFNLYNFRDEVVNFMYKKTVAESSRNSLVFYLLLFFLSAKIGEKTLLEDLLEKNINKINGLNTELALFDKLEKGQYGELVAKNGLEDVFKYDVFFTVILAFKNFSEIKNEFREYFAHSKNISSEYDRLNGIYAKSLLDFFESFEKNLIEDDRIGYTGDYLDLSKSVYRTIKMRSSRRIDLTLHKYAELKKITSQSPIVVEIIQNIDPEIITNIWDAYNLGDYVKAVWKVKEADILKNELAVGFALGYSTNAVYDASKWLFWKLIDGSKNRKEKNKAREAFRDSLEQKRQDSKNDAIQNALATSVMNSNEYLLKEITKLQEQSAKLKIENSVLVNKNEKIKELEDKIEKLENIEIEVTEISNEILE